MFADEFHGFVGIDLLDAVLLRPVHRFDHLVVAHQRHRWFALAGGCIRRAVPFAAHVVRIRKAQVMIEPAMDRQKLDLIAHVPFADALRRVALLAQQLGDRVLLGVKPHVCGGHNDFRQRDALRIAAGQQLRPRRRANRRGIERGQLQALGRHPVAMRRPIERRAVATDVAIAHVVDQDYHHVRLRLRLCERRQREEEEHAGHRHEGSSQSDHSQHWRFSNRLLRTRLFNE